MPFGSRPKLPSPQGQPLPQELPSPAARTPPPRPPETPSRPLSARRASAALATAAERNDLAGVRAVLEAVEEPAARNACACAPCGPMRVTALQLAAEHGDKAMLVLQELIQNGARASAADKLGRTPLHHAAAAGGVAATRELLAAGADPNARFRVDTVLPRRDPSSIALEDTFGGSQEGLNVMAGDGLPLPECWGRTPLHLAAKGNFPEVVSILLKAGAIADPTDERDLSPLLLAGAGVSPGEDAIVRYERVVTLLIDAGADARRCNPDTGATALHHAALLRSVTAAEVLLAAGADPAVAAEGGGGVTPLHEAAAAGAVSVIKLLLDKVDDDLVNIPDQGGRTALHKAAFAGSRSAVSLLLESGGDLAARSQAGATAADAIIDGIPRPAVFLGALFDSCVTANAASVNDRDFKIIADLRVLCPHGASEQMAVVRALMEACPPRVQAVLFQHPVLQAFVCLKWRGLRTFFLVLVAVHVAFVLSLSSYAMDLVADANQWRTQPPFCDPLWHTLMVTACVVLLYLAGQLLLLPKHYAREVETWLHMLSAVLAVAAGIVPFTSLGKESRYPAGGKNLPCNHAFQVLTKGCEPPKPPPGHESTPLLSSPCMANSTYVNCPAIDDFIDITRQVIMRNGSLCMPLRNITGEDCEVSICGAPDLYELHLLSLAVLLGWAQLMLLAGRFPTVGYYALMFQTVLVNVLKVLLSFCCLVIGFALSFAVLFSGVEGFGLWWHALGRTAVMMTGEFEYTSLFNGTQDGHGAVHTRVEFTSRIVFLLFIILAPIVLMNLMMGLAVSDIQALVEEGLVRMTLKQADFVAHLETLSTRVSLTRLCCWCGGGSSVLRRTVPTRLTLQPLFPEPGLPRLPDELLEALATIALKNRERDRRRRRRMQGGAQATVAAAAQNLMRPLGFAKSFPPDVGRQLHPSCGYSSSSSSSSDYGRSLSATRNGGEGSSGRVAAAVRVRLENEDTSAGELSPPHVEHLSPRRPSELPPIPRPSGRAHQEILRQLKRLRKEVDQVRLHLWTEDPAPTAGLLSAPSRRARAVHRKRSLAQADASAATSAASFRRRRASQVKSNTSAPPLLRRASTHLSLVASSVRDSALAVRRFRRLFAPRTALSDMEMLTSPSGAASASSPDNIHTLHL